jgi:transposase
MTNGNVEQVVTGVDGETLTVKYKDGEKKIICMLGDKTYDSSELREELDEYGTKPVIPNRSNRKQPFSFSKRLYKLRWRIEAAFNRLKDFRRIATRYDKLDSFPGENVGYLRRR